MTLWIGYGAVVTSSSQWQLNEFEKLNNSGHEFFIFKILLIAIDFNSLPHIQILGSSNSAAIKYIMLKIRINGVQ